MDERERLLRKTVGKFYDEDTGTMNWKAYVDTGVNKPLWSWPWKRKAKKGVTDCGDGE